MKEYIPNLNRLTRHCQCVVSLVCICHHFVSHCLSSFCVFNHLLCLPDHLKPHVRLLAGFNVLPVVFSVSRLFFDHPLFLLMWMPLPVLTACLWKPVCDSILIKSNVFTSCSHLLLMCGHLTWPTGPLLHICRTQTVWLQKRWGFLSGTRSPTFFFSTL